MSDLVVVEEVGATVVIQETSPADIVEVVAQGPQGPQGQQGVQGVKGDTGDVTPELVAAKVAAETAATNAAGSATSATNSASAASTSATNAATSATAAGTSATNAAASATSASGSASTATTKASEASTAATNAVASASTATTKASEASTSATNAATSATSAGSSATAAANSATSAGTSATTATTKAAEAATSASGASSSASTATTKASEASTSASGAALSATSAGTSATNAATSATNAASSASSASSSATTASTGATTATTQAGIATTKAGEASTSATSASASATTATTKAAEASASATSASGSASTAATKASEASTSASNAATSATNAATSATNAAASQTAAAGSATSAGSSATSASGSAATATTQAGIAATKASEAATSATNAASSASTATTKASEASASASAAASAQAAAESARDSTLAAFDSFDDRYLGVKTSDPTVDNDGNALVAGALYYNSAALGSGGGMKVYDATTGAWLAAYSSLSGALIGSNNLSDLASASAARTNLGLGNVENKSSATIRGEISSSNVTTALGFTPANAASLATVATTGSYADLIGKPTIFSGAYVDLTGKPTLFSGAYADLTGKPTLFSGAYVDLTGKPTNVSTFTNDAGYLTGITSTQVTTALGYTPYNSSNPSGFITSSALTPYLTSATAATTYQTQAGMSSYLTVSTASSTYQTQSGMSAYLTTSAASSGYQPLDGDLTSIAGLAGTSGFLKKTAANTWALDASTYLTGNQSISVSGDATGSGTTSIALTLANSGVTAGTYTKVTVDAKGRVTTGASLASADLPTYTGTITSTQVTTALGFTPYNATNPNGYTTNTGTVTSVGGTGTVSGLTLTGTVTGSGNLTLGGTLSLTSGQVTTALGFTPYNATNPSGYITSSGNAATATSSPLLSALNNYVWSSSTLPTSYNAGIQTAFVGPAAGEGSWQNYGSVMTIRTYSGGGGALQLYVPYGPSNGGTGMQARFGNYDVSAGNAWTSWKTLLASDNYNNYSPSLTGSGASGTWSINVTGNAGTLQGYQWFSSGKDIRGTDIYADSWLRNYNANYGLYNQATSNHWYSENSGSWTVGSTHGSYGEIRLRNGYQGTYKGSFYWDGSGVGLLNDQGGWGVRLNQGTGYGGALFGSWTIAGSTALHAGNYTSYSPSLTGGGASGTWGINISGNAATASNADTLDGIDSSRMVYGSNYRASKNDGNMNNTDTSSGFWYASSPTGGPFGDWTHWINCIGADWNPNYGYQLAHAFHSDAFAVRRVTNGSWSGWRTIITDSNYTSYAPSLTGSGASGTWGISVSGNAATATSLSNFTASVSTSSFSPDSPPTINTVGYAGQAGLPFSQTDGGVYTAGYSTAWYHQIFGDFRTGKIAVRGKNNGTWQDWRIVLDAFNFSGYALPLGGGALTGSLREARVAIAASAIDLNAGNFFTRTISGATTFTVSNVPSSGTAASFILDLTNGGSATITWWTGMKWASGAAPTLTSSGRDVLGFFTHDGGTTWTGLVLSKDVK